MAPAAEHEEHESIHEERIENTLGVVYRRAGTERFEVACARTPLRELIDREEAGILDSGEEKAIRDEAFNALVDYIFAEGPHPGVVMRRVYAIARALRPELILHMSLEEIGRLFGETKAAQSWRIKQIFNRYLKAAGCRGFKVPGQKTEASNANYAASAKGNHNRANSKKKRRK